MPAAAMTIGTIMGEISNAVTTRRQGIAGLDRPRAAKVPKTVAMKAAEKPMSAVLRAAKRHLSPKMTSSYQRME